MAFKNLDSKKHLLSKDYVYSIIIFNEEFKGDKFQEIILSSIKGFLQFFKVEIIKSFLNPLIIHGEFSNKGIIYYWIKNKCRSILIDNIPLYQIETILRHCEESEIPVYKNIDFITKDIKNISLGPYWSDKLIKLHPIIKDELLKKVDNLND